MLRRALTFVTHRIYELPVLVLMPHSRCNCRCVMCDIWKANQNKQEITVEQLQVHTESFRKLGVKYVALSGGEALMHSNLWAFCDQLKSIGVKISLLSTGVTLKAHAENVLKHVDEVIVSLDGNPEVHNRIRNIPAAFEKLSEGVKKLKELKPDFRITGRSVLQKLNFSHFIDIISTAQSLGLDQISFLPADVSSSAFNRNDPWTENKVEEIELNKQEVMAFEQLVEQSIRQFPDLYRKRFIAENPQKIREIVQYYKALLKEDSFPVKRCNAPWVSAVIEADGEVRPCFFHQSYGNIGNSTVQDIINSREAISFRKNLDMEKDATCTRCVCSLHVGLTQSF
jgi:MoaA/NifB/PqqE/SkfB family radical SAM enzyme